VFLIPGCFLSRLPEVTSLFGQRQVLQGVNPEELELILDLPPNSF
jgi:hypothetical protein